MAKEPLKSDERQKILEARLKSLGIGVNKVLRGDQLDNKHKEFISIGQTEIDVALGDIPGIACGSVVEFIGESQSGKTYCALKAAAEAHKINKRVAFLNIENSFYEPRAQALGVKTRDTDLFELYENVGAGETWGELAKALVASGEYGLVIIDSVTAMIPQADYDKRLDQEAKIGAHARMTGRLSQKLTELCSDTGTIVIFINQFRYGAGSMPGTMVKKSSGGESLGYYCHTRLVFSKINGAGGIVYSSDKEVIGGRSKVFGLKTRFGAPNFTVEFPIYFSPVESDPIIEFVMRAKAKQFELIKEVRKVFKYVTEDGEIIESKNIKEFIFKLKELPAPSKRPNNDESKSAFDFIAKKIKFNTQMIERLNEKLNSKDIEEMESFDNDFDLSEMSPDQIKEILE
jgi:RecA/RadA recombinase